MLLLTIKQCLMGIFVIIGFIVIFFGTALVEYLEYKEDMKRKKEWDKKKKFDIF